jgi:predicted RecB family nuclease
VQSRDGQVLLSPSDVTAYLGCVHAAGLSVAVALGELESPITVNEQAELVFRKGREHEAAYLARPRTEGRDVVEISLEPDFDWERAARETEEAIRLDVDVVYQAVFLNGRWRGVADFLERQADGSYEAVDTKLARHAKPAYILQLCFYSEQLARIQRREPEWIHVLLGSGERQSFRPREFAAYARRTRARLEQFVADRPATRPYPCDHCGICEFKPICDAEWLSTDSLCLVAGGGRREMKELEPAGITTLTALARAGEPALSPERFGKLRRQAALQLERRLTGQPVFDLLPPRPDSGFALLPDPSPGDLFLDLEGNPFWDELGSLEYLWGVSDVDDSFTAHWADDHASEQRAFESVVNLIHAKLAADPAMHVYHYAGYELNVLRRLAGRYGTREAEVDDLLRRGVLVDLLKVVRGGLQASVPNYGLKEMEIFLEFPRSAEIKDGGTSIIEYERYMQTRDPAILAAIAAYNREDCIATRALRDWLLERRAEALARFGPFPLPKPIESKETPSEKVDREELCVAFDAAGHALAAHLLGYHDRERRPVWWAFFDRIERTPSELVEDSESIGLLESAGAPEPVARSLVHTLVFPAQEHKLGEGQEVIDPATRKRAGEIVELDREVRRVLLKRGPSRRRAASESPNSRTALRHG